MVNFGAIETFFSDKRPFFTENQGFFVVPFGSRNPIDQLIYTRRVGGPADDGKGAGDVTAAVKFNGSAAGFNYGVFAATEADAAGRDFYAARVTREFGEQGFGIMATRVERPFLDRRADVLSFDHHWNPNQKLGINTGLVLSSIDQGGTNTDDTGAQTRIDYDAGAGWRHQLYLLHLGKDLQLNDFGFLERNNYNYLRYALSHRVTDLPKDSPFAAHDWQYVAAMANNDAGLPLTRIVGIKRQSDYRDGGTQFFEIDWTGSGHDDLITRGNGAVRIPTRYSFFLERFFARKPAGHWELYSNLHYDTGGISGASHGALGFDLQPTYHVNDRLSFYTELNALHDRDWLLWCPTGGDPCAGQGGRDLLGSYRANQLQLNGGMQWIISAKQELRIKLETIAIDAHALQGWTLAANGEPQRVADGLNDFSLRNLGFQIRYRYELAPLSNLYIAYVRGGFGFRDEGQGVGGLLGDAFDLRDDEQLFVKLSYRFEL